VLFISPYHITVKQKFSYTVFKNTISDDLTLYCKITYILTIVLGMR